MPSAHSTGTATGKVTVTGTLSELAGAVAAGWLAYADVVTMRKAIRIWEKKWEKKHKEADMTKKINRY